MSLSNLSVSGAVILFTAVGLPSTGTSLKAPTSVVASRQKEGRTIRITDSMVEVTGGANNGTIRIMNRPGSRYPSGHSSEHRSQQGQNSVRQPASRVDESYQLTVETTARSLNATLKIDGETIKSLTSASETITLSPYLSAAGMHTLEIVGTYSPATDNVQILLTGPGTQMSQQVSGSGRLRQTLRISVP
ncbi:MAG: hypothetical protein ACFB16_21340 [Phormidesmis sp.]